MVKKGVKIFPYLHSFGLGLALLASPALASNWPALLDEGMPSDLKFGAALSGIAPFERNADDKMAIGSLSKLFTAGAVLARLGEEYRFPTLVRWRQAASGIAYDVRIIGSGDPSWGLKELGDHPRGPLDKIAQALFDQGVREIHGGIRFQAADSRFDKTNSPRGWEEEDATDCGGSLAQAFNLSANCASFKLNGPREGAWETIGLDIPVELQISSGRETRLSTKLIRSSPVVYKYVIEGTWAPGQSPKNIFLPIHNPRAWIQTLFQHSLQDRGIQFPEKLAAEPTDESKELVLYSPTLSTLLKPYLKNSVNFIGDSLIKILGSTNHQSGRTDLREVGLVLQRAYLISAGLPKGYDLYDGSGLSRISRASPRVILNFLTYLKSQPYFPAFLQALAVAGSDGTLKNRMKSTAAENNLRGKTGTLDGVYNL